MQKMTDEKPSWTEISSVLSRSRLHKIFEAVGSTERLLTILEDFYEKMARDTMIGFFFREPHAKKTVKQIALQQHGFLLRAMGETKTYAGKTPAQAHTELPPILPGHFDRRLKILREVLVEHGLPEEQIETWIQFESTFRDVVVQKN
jgi:truncated hemoglobin YjbI